MKKICLVLAALSAVACSHEKPVVVTAPLPESGKRAAPVAITAEVKEDAAILTVSFEGAGEAVDVDVSGLDGLTVQSPATLMSAGAVQAREVKTWPLRLTRTAGRNALVVAVKGTFSGSPLMRVVTFTLGEGPLRQSGVKVVSDDGQAVKVMPAATPKAQPEPSGNQ